MARLARVACAALVTCAVGPVLTGCEAWVEGAPPATAATPATPALAEAQTAPPPPPPYVPSGEAGDAAEGATRTDGTRYASSEYTIGEDTDSYDDNDPAALTDFRPALDPYGTWTDDPTYGTVWVPSTATVGADFQPYVSSGHWAYDDDYVWVSDYAWGWAPFHYGRWVLIDGRGWSWIPGRQYRGAWVNWSVDDGYGYVGWSPAPPLFVWFGGAPVGWSGFWGPRWSYCPRGAVFAPRVGASVVVGPAAMALAPRMHQYGGVGARVVVGPPPARLGYAAAQVPHAAGPAAVSVTRAREFARPSTATSLGAHGPTAVPAGRGFGAARIDGYAGGGGRPSPSFPSTARTVPVPVTPGATRTVPATSSPMPRAMPPSPSVGATRAMPNAAPRAMPAPMPRAIPVSPGGGVPRPAAAPMVRPSFAPSGAGWHGGGGAVRGGGGIHR